MEIISDKKQLLTILSGVFCACLIVSNIIANKTFVLTEGIMLPCGVIVFPLVYLVNDLISEIYGYKIAKRIIILGFIMNIIAVACYIFTIYAPSAPGTDITPYQIVLGSTWRVFIASLIAYILGSLVNSKVLVYLKRILPEKLFIRCIGSTLVGEGCDSLIFITIVFINILPLEVIAIMIITQALFKTVYEVVVYPLTQYIIKKAYTLPE